MHTTWCDGKDSPEAMVEAAVAKGFSSVGFSAHAMLPAGEPGNLTPDTAPLYFAEIRALAEKWRGRIEIKDFSSVLNLGKFVIDVPNADPYKYSLTSSAEPWLWDPFNFETDMVTYIGAITVVGSITVTIPHGHMATSPELVVSDMTSQTFTITVNGVTYPLVVGTNRIPSIIIGGDADVDLTFTGDAKVQIVYRSGSL